MSLDSKVESVAHKSGNNLWERLGTWLVQLLPMRDQEGIIAICEQEGPRGIVGAAGMHEEGMVVEVERDNIGKILEQFAVNLELRAGMKYPKFSYKRRKDGTLEAKMERKLATRMKPRTRWIINPPNGVEGFVDQSALEMRYDQISWMAGNWSKHDRSKVRQLVDWNDETEPPTVVVMYTRKGQPKPEEETVRWLARNPAIAAFVEVEEESLGDTSRIKIVVQCGHSGFDQGPVTNILEKTAEEWGVEIGDHGVDGEEVRLNVRPYVQVPNPYDNEILAKTKAEWLALQEVAFSHEQPGAERIARLLGIDQVEAMTLLGVEQQELTRKLLEVVNNKMRELYGQDPARPDLAAYPMTELTLLAWGVEYVSGNTPAIMAATRVGAGRIEMIPTGGMTVDELISWVEKLDSVVTPRWGEENRVVAQDGSVIDEAWIDRLAVEGDQIMAHAKAFRSLVQQVKSGEPGLITEIAVRLGGARDIAAKTVGRILAPKRGMMVNPATQVSFAKIRGGERNKIIREWFKTALSRDVGEAMAGMGAMRAYKLGMQDSIAMFGLLANFVSKNDDGSFGRYLEVHKQMRYRWEGEERLVNLERARKWWGKFSQGALETQSMGERGILMPEEMLPDYREAMLDMNKYEEMRRGADEFLLALAGWMEEEGEDGMVIKERCRGVMSTLVKEMVGWKLESVMHVQTLLMLGLEMVCDEDGVSKNELLAGYEVDLQFKSKALAQYQHLARGWQKRAKQRSIE